MNLVNDTTCAWINDLEIRKNYKILSKDQECEWLIVGAGYTGQKKVLLQLDSMQVNIINHLIALVLEQGTLIKVRIL